MGNSSSAVASDKGSAKNSAEKVLEKVAEKRRALGRGLDSLLAGPRAVPAPAPASVPSAPVPTPAILSPVPVTAPAVPEGLAATVHEGVVAAPSGQEATARGAAGEIAITQVEADTPVVAATSVSEDAASATVETILTAGSAATATVDVLRASASGASSAEEEVVRIEIALIQKNPYQTRVRFKEGPLNELAESIRTQGVLQPIVVRAMEGGGYKLILGERRLRASILAGVETIPAIVKRVSEQQAAEMTLVENLQRQDLNCVEQAQAFSQLSREFNLTQEEIGKRVGMSRESVANYMRLLTLPEGVLEALIGGRLTYSHARALLQLNTSDHELIWAYARKAIDEKMSVAALEQLVTGLGAPRKPSNPGGARWVDPNVKAAQRSLEEVLGMRVRIRDRNGRGKIVIEYNLLEDFDRVVRMLKGK